MSILLTHIFHQQRLPINFWINLISYNIILTIYLHAIKVGHLHLSGNCISDVIYT